MLEQLADSLLSLLPFLAFGYGMLTARYVLVAGLAALVFYGWRRERRIASKIQPRWPRPSDYRREIGYSMLTSGVFIAVALLTHRGLLREYSLIYGDVGAHGWAWFALSLGIVLVFHDAYFYWAHRAMHHPRLYRAVHLVHHRSTNPTPWAAFAFHPIEAVFEALPIVAISFLIPVHFGVLALSMLIMTVYNVYGHLGWELYPKGFARHPIGRFINTSISHNYHHEKARDNYGLYFLWWDRWFGTLDPEYEARFERVAERDGEHEHEREPAPANPATA